MSLSLQVISHFFPRQCSLPDSSIQKIELTCFLCSSCLASKDLFMESLGEFIQLMSLALTYKTMAQEGISL